MEGVIYNICICEENKNVRDALRSIVSCYFSAKGIKANLKSFDTAEELMDNCEFADAVFLDVDYNSITTIEIAYTLIKRYPHIFLYILSDRYTCLDAAMDIKAFRYLPKKFDIKRIVSSLNIVTTRKPCIEFMSNYMSVHLNESQIVCIYSKERRTIVLSDSGVKYPTTISIKTWMEKLAGSQCFLHPHYSYIINKNYISSFDGKVITIKCKDGKTMNVFPSQRKIGEVKTALLTDLDFYV